VNSIKSAVSKEFTGEEFTAETINRSDNAGARTA